MGLSDNARKLTSTRALWLMLNRLIQGSDRIELSLASTRALWLMLNRLIQGSVDSAESGSWIELSLAAGQGRAWPSHMAAEHVL